MKSNLPPMVVGRRGMTLLELTMVIVIMLTLVGILAIGSRAWKRACDRSACVMNLRNFQMATRSYQNLNGYDYGGRPVLEHGTQDIANHLLERGFITRGLHDQAKGIRVCAGGGIYHSAAPDVFPMPGELYMKCSLSSAQRHLPDRIADW